MKSILTFAAAALSLAATTRSAEKKPRPGPEVVVVSDAMAGENADLRPAPNRPIYYFILGNVERSLGQPIAGEPAPDPKVLDRELEKALASQGFVRTRVGGPMPALALIVTWGTANLLIDDITTTNDTTGESSTSSVVYNRREISQLVGADKANQRLLSNDEAEAINDAARQDRLYLFIGAFDAPALAKKQKKLLWRTRISIESRRTSLPESIGVMLASAAPFFGRDTEKPIFVDDTLRRKAEVIIGTPVVVPNSPKDAPPEKKAK